jgi:acyl carrier protein
MAAVLLRPERGSVNEDQNLRRTIMDLLVAEGHGNDAVTSQTALTDGGLELTSLELVRLLVSLEERLGIELDDATIMNGHFDTVDDIVALVAQSA